MDGLPPSERVGAGAGSGGPSRPALHPVRIFVGSRPKSHSFPAGSGHLAGSRGSANDSGDEAVVRSG